MRQFQKQSLFVGISGELLALIMGAHYGGLFGFMAVLIAISAMPLLSIDCCGKIPENCTHPTQKEVESTASLEMDIDSILEHAIGREEHIKMLTDLIHRTLQERMGAVVEIVEKWQLPESVKSHPGWAANIQNLIVADLQSKLKRLDE